MHVLFSLLLLLAVMSGGNGFITHEVIVMMLIGVIDAFEAFFHLQME